MGDSKLTGCCTFTKFLFIFFNILFFLVGAAALGVGIWAQVSKDFTVQLYDLLENAFKLDRATVDVVIEPEVVENAAILIIVGGAIVMLLGFLGCFGAMRESQCLLVTFFLSLFLILGIIVAGTILVLAFPQTVEKNFKPQFEKVFKKWVANHNANGTVVLIQEKLKCCGIDGKEDYGNVTIPNSCRVGDAPSGAIFDVGCVKAFATKLNSLLKEYPWVVGGIAIGVLAILIMGMVLSCCLCFAVRKVDKGGY